MKNLACLHMQKIVWYAHRNKHVKRNKTYSTNLQKHFPRFYKRRLKFALAQKKSNLVGPCLDGKSISILLCAIQEQ